MGKMYIFKNLLVKKIGECEIHQSLESTGCVTKSKGHSIELVWPSSVLKVVKGLDSSDRGICQKADLRSREEKTMFP